MKTECLSKLAFILMLLRYRILNGSGSLTPVNFRLAVNAAWKGGFLPEKAVLHFYFNFQDFAEFGNKKDFSLRLISFLLYFSKLRLGVLLGFHKTANPLDLKWRWNYLQGEYQRRRFSSS